MYKFFAFRFLFHSRNIVLVENEAAVRRKKNSKKRVVSKKIANHRPTYVQIAWIIDEIGCDARSR